MLSIGDTFVTFEPSSTASDSFYDDLNQRICTVRGNGEMGVTAKGLNKSDVISFRIPDQGKIMSLNFSQDSQIVAIRRENTAVDFIFLPDKVGDKPPVIVRQPSKSLNIVLGLQWVSDRQVLSITDQGIDLYTINSRRQSVKFVKSICITVHWFTSYTPSHLLLISNGISNASLNPFLFQNNTIHQLKRFEADFGCSASRPKLMERDITIASIYERISVLVLKSGKKDAVIEQVNIYEFTPDDPFKAPQLMKVLKLNFCGLVGVHVLDNAIFIHHKSTSTSYVFEVGPPSTSESVSSSANFSQTPKSTTKSSSVREFHATCVTNVIVADELHTRFFDDCCGEISLYNSTSAIFAPNFVADLRLGIFATLSVVESAVADYIKEDEALLDFLIRRRTTKEYFLKVFMKSLLNKSIKICKICYIFRQLLEAHKLSMTKKELPPTSTASKICLTTLPFLPLSIDHDTILRNVFDPLRNDEKMDKKLLAYLVMEFFLIVKRLEISLENYLHEFLLRVMVDAKQFNKLQQLLQYGVIDDSKFLAFELIALGRDYEPLQQMAVDMLARRGNMEQIAEVFITQGRVVEAARCIAFNNHYRVPTLDRYYCLKLLEGAWKSKNRQLMYTVFTHLRYVQKVEFFDKNDKNYDEFFPFIQDYNALFEEEELEEAEKRFRMAKISPLRADKRARQSAAASAAEDGQSLEDNHSTTTSATNTTAEDEEDGNNNDFRSESSANGMDGEQASESGNAGDNNAPRSGGEPQENVIQN